MEVNLEPGKYVVAVSGGVDSVMLLHLLATFHLPTSTFQFVVAHYDHGIREDSGQDRQFVSDLADKYGLQFYYGEGKLGPKTSEAAAREARYEFLRKIRKSTEAKAIITAHHQDDLLETAFINVLRGTGRKGLSSLGSTEQIKRPLLHMTKQDIKDYTRKHNIDWREDITNQDNDYLRNNLRNRILPRITSEQRSRLLGLLKTMKNTNDEIDKLLEGLMPKEPAAEIDRPGFISLPHIVAREVVSHWLRQQGISFDRQMIERLTISLKTLPAGTHADISGGWHFALSKDYICLER